MVFAMNGQDDSQNFIPFDLESARVQSWWDTIQSRNRYFFELVEMRLYYIENADLYLLLLEMDDCIDDLDIVECPPNAAHLRDNLEHAVQDMTMGLISLAHQNTQKAQLYFNTARAQYQQIVLVDGLSTGKFGST